APERRVVVAPARRLSIKLGQRPFAVRIYEQRSGGVDELVAGGARDRPIVRQLLAGLEDLLDELPCAGASLVQPLEILERIVQPVDMVDANAVQDAGAQPFEHTNVEVAKDFLALGPHADQRVDIEEPTVAELPARDSPVREPIVLPVYHRVEHIGVPV